jgi:hypothetical protein
MPYIKDSKGELYGTPVGFIPLTAGGTVGGNSSKSGTPALQSAPSTNGLNQNYKSFQYLYAAKKFKETRISGLFFADHFGKYVLDSITTAGDGRIYGRRFNQKGTNVRMTTGTMVTSTLDKKKQWGFSGGFYYQFGKDRDGLDLSAYTTTVALTYGKGKMSYTAGMGLPVGE